MAKPGDEKYRTPDPPPKTEKELQEDKELSDFVDEVIEEAEKIKLEEARHEDEAQARVNADF